MISSRTPSASTAPPSSTVLYQRAPLFPSSLAGMSSSSMFLPFLYLTPLILPSLFYMPGTLIGAFFVDWLGPKYTMIIGLLLQSLFGFFMSGFYSHLKNHIAGFAVMYGIFLSFGEFGVCSYIITQYFFSPVFLIQFAAWKLFGSYCSKEWSYSCPWSILRCSSCRWQNRRVRWNMGFPSYD